MKEAGLEPIPRRAESLARYLVHGDGDYIQASRFSLGNLGRFGVGRLGYLAF